MGVMLSWLSKAMSLVDNCWTENSIANFNKIIRHYKLARALILFAMSTSTKYILYTHNGKS